MTASSTSARKRLLTRSVAVAACAASAFLLPASAADQGSAVPMFSPFPNNGWVPDRPTGDDFIPVPGKPEPVKSDPAHASPPEPGGAPMAPRASAHEEMEEGEESEYSDENPADSDEVSGQSEDDTADQKAKAAARLGKKLRRKALAKERPPAEA